MQLHTSIYKGLAAGMRVLRYMAAHAGHALAGGGGACYARRLPATATAARRGQPCHFTPGPVRLPKSFLLTLVSITFFASIFTGSLHAQTIFPIQAQLEVDAPFTGYLPDYTDDVTNKMRVRLTQLDLTQPNYSVVLKWKIEGTNFTLLPYPSFNSPVIFLNTGVNLIQGSELATYIDTNHLQFPPVIQQSYGRNRILPEGFYTISVQAFDAFNPNIPVSNQAFIFLPLTYAQPPLLNAPFCGSELNVNAAGVNNFGVNLITFNWTPLLGVWGMYANNLEYKFELYRIESTNPNIESAAFEAINTHFAMLDTNIITNVPVLMLDAAEYGLEIGKRYAWRVQVKSTNGQNFITNNGYSQPCSFIFGNQVTSLYGDVEIDLNAGATMPRQGNAIWTSSLAFDEYIIEIRKTGNPAYEWFADTVPSLTTKMNQLEPLTQYECRVKGRIIAEDYESDYSNIAVFTTPPLPTYNCGQSPNLLLGPLTYLEHLKQGDRITSGYFEFTVLTAQKLGAGRYKGTGMVVIPYVGFRFGVEFSDITIDENYYVRQGEIRVKSEGIEGWLAGQLANEFGGNNTGEVVTGEAGTDEEVNWNIENITLSQNYDGTWNITVNGSNGETTTFTGTLPFTIQGSGGEMWYADSDGSTGLGAINDYLANGLPANTDTLSDKGRAYFTAYTSQHYGFDEWLPAYINKPNVEGEYKLVPQINNGTAYHTYQKSIKANGFDKVDYTIQNLHPTVPADSIKFISKTGTLFVKDGSGRLKLIGGPADDAQEIYAVFKDALGRWHSLGKLKMSGYATEVTTIVFVPVKINGVTPTIDTNAVKAELKKIYTPAIAQFNLEIAGVYADSSWDKNGDGKLDVGSTDFFAQYTDEMQDLNRNYRNFANVGSSNKSYVFIVPEASEASVKGEMPRGRKWGYLFGTNITDGKLVAHEIGHGKFKLYHSFDNEVGLNKGSTDNLMDYTSASEQRLLKFQWDLVHDPAADVTQGDEEGDGESEQTLLSESSIDYDLSWDNDCWSDNYMLEDGTIINFNSTSYDCVFMMHRNKPNIIVGIKLYQRVIENNDTNYVEFKRIDLKNINDANAAKSTESLNVTINIVNTHSNVKINCPQLVSKCFYNNKVAELNYNPSNNITSIYNDVASAIQTSTCEWYTFSTFSASPDCFHDFATTISSIDNNTCSDVAQVNRTTLTLERICNGTDIVNKLDSLVLIINSNCKEAIRNLSYSNQIKIINTIVYNSSLSDKQEVAILRTMSVINPNNYELFYQDLEANNNELIKALISKTHDKVLWVFGNNNYTNFIGGLCWMFNINNRIETISNETDLQSLTRIINLNPIQCDLAPHWSTNSKIKYSSSYSFATGKITLSQKAFIDNTNGTFGGIVNELYPETNWMQFGDDLGELNPLSPILITTYDELPIVQTALESSSQVIPNHYIVPAIFLKYREDKNLNESTGSGVMLTLDLVTIYASGGTALATKIGWIKRLIALGEVVGAVGNIAVNTGAINPTSNPVLYDAVLIYNGVMIVIGAKNAVNGIYNTSKGLKNFALSLSQDVINSIKNNTNLKILVAAKYLEWKIKLKSFNSISEADKTFIDQGQIESVSFISGAEKTELVNQEKVFKLMLGGENVVNGAGKLVDNLNLGTFVKKIGDYDVFAEGEIFYRGMSQADYQYLLNNGKIRAPLNSPTSEVFTSPSLEYIKSVGYGGDGVIVKFKMKSGTLDNLVSNGVRDQSNRAATLFPNMQSTNISGWEANGKVYFKQETIHNTTTKQVNIGLGKNENGGLKYFNGENGSNILEFQIVQ